MAGDKVQLTDFWPSMVGMRLGMFLPEKGIEYEYKEEDLRNKSPFPSSNPVHNKILVLIHNDKPDCESLIIGQYIDDSGKDKGPILLPRDPYPRLLAWFWADFIDKNDSCNVRRGFSGDIVLSGAGHHLVGELGSADKNGAGQKFVGEIIGNRSAPSGQQNILEKMDAEKGIEYVYKEEELRNKSPFLLSSNPVDKKTPVLIQYDKPICESLIIGQNVDDPWKDKGPISLPQDPYERELATSWVDFIDKRNSCNVRQGFSGDIGNGFLTALKAVVFLLGLYLGVFIKKHFLHLFN